MADETMRSLFSVPRTAIVRDLPDSFADCLKQELPKQPIDVALARAQHGAYTRALRALVSSLIELPTEETHPDCCFVEDTAVVIDQKAALCRLGAEERRGEEERIGSVLRAHGIETRVLTAPATMDGGDVLHTGRHLFVGLSRRTNGAAATQLADLFPALPVVSAPVEGSLHLKSVMSALDRNTLLFAEHEAAERILTALREKGVLRDYHVERIPDAVASNVLSLGDTLVIQAGFPKSEDKLVSLARARRMRVVKLHMSELIKADGALTCCSLLF